MSGLVWERLGADISNLVDPFFGSGAVLLGRPGGAQGIETVNDKDGLLCNAWRAMQHDPEQTAYWADWPVSECDLHARHIWLVQRRQELTLQLEGDPDYYDARVAGWWIWGICCWIGSGWCSGEGPWGSVGGKLVHLGDAGQGVYRQRVHLGDGQGVHRKVVHLGDAGQGVYRKLVHLGNAGQGVHRRLAEGNGEAGLYDWFAALSERLRRVRVCCGDWRRVLGPTPTTKLGLSGIFLDPPYMEGERDPGLYAEDAAGIAQDVRQWAIEHGDDPLLRIALCGYEAPGYDMPDSWECVPWKAHGGYGTRGNGAGRENAYRERVWFSHACLRPDGPRQLAMEGMG